LLGALYAVSAVDFGDYSVKFCLKIARGAYREFLLCIAPIQVHICLQNGIKGHIEYF